MPENQSGAGDADVKRSLIIYSGCSITLWLIALTSAGIQAKIFHRSFPHNTLFLATARFTDFTIYYPRFLVYGNADAFFSPSGYPFQYPAPLLVCFLFYWRFLKDPLAWYLVVICAFACLLGWVALRCVLKYPRPRKLAAAVVAAAGLFSFPFMFLLDRGNIEGLVWIATAAGLLCFTKRHYQLAAVFLGLATSMKIFPGVLLLLFLAKRKYRAMGLSMISWAAFTLASLRIIGPSISRAFRGIAMGVDFFRQVQILKFRPEIGFDHSLFTFVKWIALCLSPNISRVDTILPELYIPYALCAMLGFMLLYGFRLRRIPVLNQILALSAISVLLPFVSYEYTLVHLIVPFILLVIFLVRDVAGGLVVLKRGQILALLIPFALILGPAYLPLPMAIGIGGQIKTLALIYLIGASLQVALPSSLFGELA